VSTYFWKEPYRAPEKNQKINFTLFYVPFIALKFDANADI